MSMQHAVPRMQPQMHPQQAVSAQAQAKRSSWSPSVSNDAKENQAGNAPCVLFLRLATVFACCSPVSAAWLWLRGNMAHPCRALQKGVGILFVEEEDPSGFVRVTVKALIEGGSAERTGMVRAGDMVVRVGNQDVIGKPLSVLRTMIPGPIGSYCRLGFLRGGVALNPNAVQVRRFANKLCTLHLLITILT